MLKDYKNKRNFSTTPEPSGDDAASSSKTDQLHFVIHLHRATALHHDLRLELDGVLKSWAVPKGPSRNPHERRLAVQVEDHPVDYGKFEGVIPPGQYGSGEVIIWDRGTYVDRRAKTHEESIKNIRAGLAAGKLTIIMSGHKLAGEFALVRLADSPKNWLLIKKADRYAHNKEDHFDDSSVVSGRTLDDIKSGRQPDVWFSNRQIDEQRPADPLGCPKNLLAKRTTPTREKFSRQAACMKPVIAERMRLDHPDWLYQLQPEGLRALITVRSGLVTITSAQGRSLTSKFREIATNLKGSKDLIVDGIITRPSADGYSKPTSDGPVKLLVSDLLHYDGRGMKGLPLGGRLGILDQLPIFSDSVVRHRQWSKVTDQLERRAREVGLVAIRARHRRASYSSGVTASWREMSLQVTDRNHLRLTNLDKVYWPKERITKGQVLDYYRAVSEWMLPHLVDRCQSMHRHPNGIEQPSFFHKNVEEFTPPFVQTVKIFSRSSGRTINYLLCNNRDSLLFMANHGCIEVNPWLSRCRDIYHPDFSAIDIDPPSEDYFGRCLEIAALIHELAGARDYESFCKTSGGRGLHVYLPCHDDGLSYEQARELALSICQQVVAEMPDTTLERNPAKRGKKIYLDCYQIGWSQTLAAVYSVRPRPGAPVSCPVSWPEVKSGGFVAQDFNMNTVPARLSKTGDLFLGCLPTG